MYGQHDTGIKMDINIHTITQIKKKLGYRGAERWVARGQNAAGRYTSMAAIEDLSRYNYATIQHEFVS